MFSNLKALTIPNGEVVKIECNGSVLWEMPSSYTNQVPISTNESGNVYNSLGYKNGYRLRSSGAEGTSGTQCCTGFIPCKAGDIIRFCFASKSPLWTAYTSAYTGLNFSNTSKTNIGQITSQPASYGIFEGTTEVNKVKKVGDVWEYTVPNNSDIRFVRFTAPYYSNNNWIGGADLIVTVNEPISQSTIEKDCLLDRIRTL